MNTLFTIVTALAVTFGGLLGLNAPQSITDNAPREDALGSDIKLLAGFTYYLAGTGISSSGTSFTLTNFTIKQNGYEIQDSDLEDTFYFTLEPGNPTRQEILACTTVVQNADNTATISGCSRGMAPIQPYSASTTLQFAHAGGSAAILSDPPQILDELYDYVNSLALGSTTVSATTLAAGFVELATQAEMAASAILGGSGSSLVLQAQYATSSAPASGNYIPVTGSDGNLAEGFIPDSYLSTVKATSTRVVAWGTGTSGSSAGSMWSVTIPANSVGPTDYLEIEIPISSITANPGSTCYIGATLAGQVVYATTTGSSYTTAAHSGSMFFKISATTTAAQQYYSGTNMILAAGTASSTNRYGFATVNTTSDAKLDVYIASGGGVTCSWNAAYRAPVILYKN